MDRKNTRKCGRPESFSIDMASHEFGGNTEGGDDWLVEQKDE